MTATANTADPADPTPAVPEPAYTEESTEDFRNPAAPARAATPAIVWDSSPDMDPPPFLLVLLVTGEHGVGKTHIAFTIPGPLLMIDTDLRGDDVIKKFRSTKPIYRKIPDSFLDVRFALKAFFDLYPQGGGVVVFDSASDLQDLILREVEANASKNNPQSLHHTFRYVIVYAKYKKLCHWIRSKGHHIVFTGRLGEEYVSDKKTGERVPSSFIANKVSYQANFGIEIQVKDGVRSGRVFKNGAKKPGTYREVLTDEELTYEGIVRAMEEDSEAVSNIKAAASLISSATDRLIAAASVEAPDAPEAKSEPDPNEPHGTSPSVDPDLIEAIAEIERLASFFPNYRSEPSRIWDGLVARGKATGHRSISLANAYEVIETLGKTLAAQGVRVH